MAPPLDSPLFCRGGSRFSVGWAPTLQQRRQHIIFTKFSEKLHEIEKFWCLGGGGGGAGSASLRSLDPPLFYFTPFSNTYERCTQIEYLRYAVHNLVCTVQPRGIQEWGKCLNLPGSHGGTLGFYTGLPVAELYSKILDARLHSPNFMQF